MMILITLIKINTNNEKKESSDTKEVIEELGLVDGCTNLIMIDGIICDMAAKNDTTKLTVTRQCDA